MITHSILEAWDVVVTALASLVGQVQTDTHIEADDDKRQYVTKSGARAQSQIVEETAPFELATGPFGIFSEQPDVTAIEEGRAFQVSQDGESIFQVRFELQVTGPIDIGIGIVLVVHVETARTDAADREGADTVGATDIELFVIRRGPGIAIAVDGARHDAADQMMFWGQLMVIPEFSGSFDELRKGVA